MMPATLSIITNAFPPHERGKAIGTWAGVSALALAIGPVVGGFLVEHVSWQSIFFLNLPVAAGAVAITLFATQESRDETVVPKVDFAGIATLTVGLGALVLALVEAGTLGLGLAGERRPVRRSPSSGSPRSRVDRAPRPRADGRLRVLPLATFLGANLVAFIVSFAMLAMFFFIALYMQNILGYSPLEAGVRFLPTTLVHHRHRRRSPAASPTASGRGR